MPETRTIEQAEHTVETVEHTEYQCPNCSQWFENDELHDVKIGSTETILCSGCGDAIFDVDDDPSGIETETSDSDTEYSSTGGSISITLIVTAVVLFVGLQVTNDFMQSVSSTELERAMSESSTALIEPLVLVQNMFGVFGMILMGAILWVTIRMTAHGPRY